jgi:hypothetical protein
VKAHDHLAVDNVNGRSRRWLSLAGLAFLVACGGGGGATGTTPFGDGSGTSPLGNGAGTPPFGVGGGGGLTGDGPRPNPDPAVVVSTAAVQGTVVDAASGAALSGASVRYGSSTLTTGTDGRYEEDPAGTTGARVVFQAAASGYEPLFAPTEVLGAVPAVNLLQLTPSAAATDITVVSGGTVTAAGASVTVPANALVAAGGGAAPATVGMRVTAIALGIDPHRVSGNYIDSVNNSLEAYAAVNLETTVGVEVADGQSLSLSIPVSSRTRNAELPLDAVLYLLDPSTGRWGAYGQATLSGTAYSASVGTFGQWMVGAAIDAGVNVTGCVQDDNGQPAANVRMELEGLTYSGTTQVTTGSQGTFTLKARRDSRVIVSGRRGSFLTNSAARDVATTDVSVDPCLTVPSSNGATVRLNWGQDPEDVDAHLRTPGGGHVSFRDFGSLTAAPFASLDVDDRFSFGPEVTSIRRPRVGIYRYYVHNWSRSLDAGAANLTASPTSVELNYAGRQLSFRTPSNEGTALWWHVFDLYIAPDCTMTLYRYNRWLADEPQNPNAATTPTTTATECVPS